MSMLWTFLLLLALLNTYLCMPISVSSATVTLHPLGGPGTRVAQDKFNIAGVWNRTYGETEPQQIHLAWVSNGVACRVQFATRENTDGAIFRYWRAGFEEQAQVIQTERGRAFEDGGEAHHTVYLHSITSDRLEPATLYHYQVASYLIPQRFEWSPIYRFHSPSTEDAFSFVATADMGTANAVSLANLQRAAQSHAYDFIAYAGDQAYDMADFNGTKGDEYMNFVQDIYATLPTMTAVGNHEHAYNFSHYKHRFSILPHAESGFPDPTMYSFDYKALHLVAISSEVFFENGSPDQMHAALHWLEADLQAARQAQRPWIVVMAHRPLYCTPADPEDEDCGWKAQVMRHHLEELFLRYRVDIYLCGHRHNYERTFPVAHDARIATSYRNAPSFFQLGVGNAGNFQGPDTFLKDPRLIRPWSALRYPSYGFSTIKVTPHYLDIEHFESHPHDGSLGKRIDFVRVRKH
ncbi:Metallo-dependent phosphatase-like protein, partial [Syncephalastrum racemosum]